VNRAIAAATNLPVATRGSMAAPAQRSTTMDDQLKVWTTVGSAGTLNHTDLAKVSLHQSIVQLGTELSPPVLTQLATAQVAGASPRVGPIFPAEQAVVRYNVTPVDGLFLAGAFKYHLQLRYRGQVSARLMQVDIETGAETLLIAFDSNSFPAKHDFQVQAVSATEDSAILDFVNKAYYVEATLTAPALVVGHPAAISIIKLFASPNFPG
jgi:hypothetical protein